MKVELVSSLEQWWHVKCSGWNTFPRALANGPLGGRGRRGEEEEGRERERVGEREGGDVSICRISNVHNKLICRVLANYRDLLIISVIKGTCWLITRTHRIS